MKLRMLVVIFLIFACQAMADGRDVAHVPLPADLTGTLNGADYIIRVPVNWNGTLLVFAHATQLGPPVAEAAPVAWPIVTPSLEEQLLASGYALAGSGYQNSDKDGVQRTLALTNFFKGTVGNPSRIIIWGNSLGGQIVLKLIEEHPGIYDGAVANCAPIAGTPENVDSTLAFGLAYDAAFGWRDDLWGPVEDVRDDVDFWADVLPIVMWPAPDTIGRWEFIRLVMQLPAQAFYQMDPQTASPFLGMQMWKATEKRGAVDAAYGGPVAENIGIQYTLKPEEKTYLASLGVDADQLLAAMNARADIAADIAARNHAEHWGGFHGNLRSPVLTMHSIFDGLVFVSQESYYAALAEAAGSSDMLMQAYVDTIGHCSFTADQYLSTLTAMDSWLNTGVRPDESLLPASKGFNLGYVPWPWPF